MDKKLPGTGDHYNLVNDLDRNLSEIHTLTKALGNLALRQPSDTAILAFGADDVTSLVAIISVHIATARQQADTLYGGHSYLRSLQQGMGGQSHAG